MTLALMLASCAGTAWTQAGKTEAQKRTDLAACERQAESDTLGGINRADYPLPTSSGGTMPGSRTSAPLEMHDRAEVTSRYDRAVNGCMRGKGYMQGHAADQRPAG
jgi:hypothetical protein